MLFIVCTGICGAVESGDDRVRVSKKCAVDMSGMGSMCVSSI